MGLRKGSRHDDITIVSEHEDGFPYHSAQCKCGWSSVKHHRPECAEAEGTWHSVSATGSREPGGRP